VKSAKERAEAHTHSAETLATSMAGSVQRTARTTEGGRLVGIFGKSSASDEVSADLAAVVVASSDKTRALTLKSLAERTNQRTLSLKKGSVKQQLRHEEVAEASIREFPNGDPLVQIESLKSRLGYKQQDNRRFEWIITVDVGTPRVTQAICAAVDQFLPKQ
jgi:hypothetical protein